METALHLNQPNSLSPSKKARIISLLVLLLWAVVLVYPFFSYRFPPPELQGVLISFGETMEESDEASSSETEQLDQQENEEKSNTQKVVKSSEKKANLESNSAKKTVLKSVSKPSTEEDSPIPISKKTQSNTQKKKGKSTDQKNQKHIESNTKKKEENSSSKQDSEATKNAFSSFFNKKENTNKQKTGSDKGVPASEHTRDMVSGESHIGEGLVKRGIIFQPEIVDNSQKTGKVVIKVCVDSNGKVISAKHTLSGSTTTDRNLVKIAEKAAKQYVFSASGIEKQCGKISIDFKLK